MLPTRVNLSIRCNINSFCHNQQSEIVAFGCGHWDQWTRAGSGHCSQCRLALKSRTCGWPEDFVLFYQWEENLLKVWTFFQSTMVRAFSAHLTAPVHQVSLPPLLDCLVPDFFSFLGLSSTSQCSCLHPSIFSNFFPLPLSNLFTLLTRLSV